METHLLPIIPTSSTFSTCTQGILCTLLSSVVSTSALYGALTAFIPSSQTRSLAFFLFFDHLFFLLKAFFILLSCFFINFGFSTCKPLERYMKSVSPLLAPTGFFISFGAIIFGSFISFALSYALWVADEYAAFKPYNLCYFFLLVRRFSSFHIFFSIHFSVQPHGGLPFRQPIYLQLAAKH